MSYLSCAGKVLTPHKSEACLHSNKATQNNKSAQFQSSLKQLKRLIRIYDAKKKTIQRGECVYRHVSPT